MIRQDNGATALDNAEQIKIEWEKLGIKDIEFFCATKELGVKLQLVAKPSASKEKISLNAQKVLTVAIHAPPQDGRANAAIISLLAKRLGLSCGGLKLLRGEKSKIKIFSVYFVLANARDVAYYKGKVENFLD